MEEEDEENQKSLKQNDIVSVGVANENRSICSYGISIDTSNIQSVNREQQDEELQLLDVDVYEQENFEKGVFHQVNSVLSNAEKRFKQNILQKEIIQIKNEIKIVTGEKDDINKVFLSAKDGGSTNTVSFSLLQQKQSKEALIKRLETKLLDTQQRLLKLDKNEDDKAKQDYAHDESVRLGKITPFEALGMKKNARSEKPENETTRVESSDDESSEIIQKKESLKEKITKLSDDDYVPEYHDVSSDDDAELVDMPEKIVKKEKLNQKKPKNYMQGTIDDGDFNSFRERMRKLHVKNTLRHACKAGEVMEEYDPADFSDNEDSDDEVVVEDDFVLPKKTWNKLYRYQRVGVRWLWQLHNQQAGGIVGDEMGLGKTIQIISFLAGLAYSKKKATTANRNLGLGPVLIVCPATVMKQWVAEFHKWWPKFRVGILHDSGSFSGRKATLIKAINNHPGVLITTYAGVRINKKELYRYHWQYVILDEGHKIRNPDSDVTLACKQFDTPHRIILTGTPMQNSLKELWSLFDFAYPGRLGTLPVFMTEFSVPITMGGYANASSVQVQTAYKCSCVLRDTVSPYMLRRLKKDVKKSLELPTKNEQVLFCKLTDEQKELYKEYINSKDVAAMLAGNMKVFPGLIKLRKICNHPDLVYLHEQNESNALRVFDGGYGNWKRSGKMVVVESLLRIWNEKGHHVLLFSQSKQMLNILEEFLKTFGYTYLRMDGTTNVGSRQTLVKKFNEDKNIFVFLLTTRVGGLGLNLIGADRVIIYDPDWNPSTDTQARERSWRIGQERHVTIYRLMTTGTIEEKIYHRQIFKQFLTNRVLTNPLQRRFFKSNDLYELFALGDIGPMQSTETGAIFAGTGSEIRMRRKGKHSKNSDEQETLAKKVKTSKKYNVEVGVGDGAEKMCDQGVSCPSLNKQQRSCEPKTEVSSETPLQPGRSIGTSFPAKSNKKRKKKKKKRVAVDGVQIDDVEKSEAYRCSDDEEQEGNDNIQNEKDVLMSLFRSSGLHSALKHDRIEQAGNPDYVLVEKEAEKVAKQAVNALRQSRAECRNNGLSVPTWTGHTKTVANSSITKKPRFGKKSNKNVETAAVKPSVLTNEDLDLESETIDVSSSALLARMRTRNMFGTSSSSSQVTSEGSSSKEVTLLKDIQEFMLQQTYGTATTNEMTSFFATRIEKTQNALFKQLLKQICDFHRRDDGVGNWKLKEEFK